MKTETTTLITKSLITGVCAFLISVSSQAWADTSIDKKQLLTESDRRLLLTSISENAMLPIFKELKISGQSLLEKTESFCSSKTDSSFNDLRNAWTHNASAWQQADSLLFGPTVDDNIDFSIYFLPIKKGIIKGLLQKETLTKSDVDSAGVGAQGFGALEYLLFSRTETAAEILKNFIDDSRNCHYLLKTTELLQENINTISRQWEHYGVQFGLAGNSSLYFLESDEAMILLVNKLYQSAQKVSNKKIGLLNNKQKIKKSTSYKLQAWRSGKSLEQAKANIEGIKRILDDGKVLEWLEKNNKQQAAEEIRTVIEQILQQKVTDNDLFTTVQKSPESLQTLVKNTTKLTELFKTEIAPSLGVELGFNDNDGD